MTAGDWTQNNKPAISLLNQLTSILNSNGEFTPDDSFTLDITHIHLPNGSGGAKRRKLGSLDYVSLMKQKHSVIQIKNKDEICCARALVTAIARHEKGLNEECLRDYDCIRHGRPLQEKRARTLHEKANVTLGPCGLEEIAKFQAVLQDHQIINVSADYGNAIIFTGDERPKQLCLLLH